MHYQAEMQRIKDDQESLKKFYGHERENLLRYRQICVSSSLRLLQYDPEADLLAVQLEHGGNVDNSLLSGARQFHRRLDLHMVNPFFEELCVERPFPLTFSNKDLERLSIEAIVKKTEEMRLLEDRLTFHAQLFNRMDRLLKDALAAVGSRITEARLPRKRQRKSRRKAFVDRARK